VESASSGVAGRVVASAGVWGGCGNPAGTLEAASPHQADNGAEIPWGTLRFRAETGRDGGMGMAKGDAEDLAAQAAKRAEFRVP
jgi:hypothetical protein